MYPIAMARNGRAAGQYERHQPGHTRLYFIARLVALVPKPHVNLTRYHAMFAPNSQYHAFVTPAKRGKGNKRNTPPDTDVPHKLNVVLR